MPSAQGRRTAIVVIHGMGEQRPMETLWGFVEAAWRNDADLIPPERSDLFSQPYDLERNFELRRITTRNAVIADESRRRFDFFEFYWAHLMTGNTVNGLTAWLRSLLLRSPASVPRRLLGLWAFATIVFAAGLALFIASAVAKAFPCLDLPDDLLLVSGIGVTLIGLFARAWAVPVAGDAARYLSATPGNVAARQRIREAGLAMLSELQRNDRYDRVVLVGHSLGAVIAYDLLCFLWGTIPQAKWAAIHQPNGSAARALKALETAAAALTTQRSEASLSAYRDSQRAYFAALRKGGAEWVVSDLVTLGNPLSKADVLLARDDTAFAAKKARRELPTDPPLTEADGAAGSFSFTPPGTKAAIPHHAAPFAPVVWTNIWFPSCLLLLGDIISGPVAKLLGLGIRNVRVPIGGLRFRHLDYWRDPAADRPWLRALRRGLNLRGADEAALWDAAIGEGRLDR